MKNVIFHLGKWLDHIFKFVEYVAGLFLGCTCIAVLAQVISRYFFNQSFNWAEELPVVFFAWFGFLGAAVAMHRGEHLGVEFLVKKFSKTIQRLLKLIVYLDGIVFFSFILYYGYIFSLSMMKVQFVTFPLPKGWFYMSIVVSSALMILTLAFQFIRQLVFWRED